MRTAVTEEDEQNLVRARLAVIARRAEVPPVVTLAEIDRFLADPVSVHLVIDGGAKCVRIGCGLK